MGRQDSEWSEAGLHDSETFDYWVARDYKKLNDRLPLVFLTGHLILTRMNTRSSIYSASWMLACTMLFTNGWWMMSGSLLRIRIRWFFQWLWFSIIVRVVLGCQRKVSLAQFMFPALWIRVQGPAWSFPSASRPRLVVWAAIRRSSTASSLDVSRERNLSFGLWEHEGALRSEASEWYGKDAPIYSDEGCWASFHDSVCYRLHLFGDVELLGQSRKEGFCKAFRCIWVVFGWYVDVFSLVGTLGYC